MRSTHVVRFLPAVAIALGLAAFVGTTASAQSQPPTGAAATSPQTTAAAEQVTVIGCIEREADYRKARDAGRGGVAGTGVGAGNEFVLTNASLSKGAGATGTTGATPEPTGTAGAAATSVAYELTGANEGQAAQHVGRRVEISGKLKAAEVKASGTPTGGATAGQPPTGVDVAGRDLRLRELEVASIREAAGTCPAK